MSSMKKASVVEKTQRWKHHFFYFWYSGMFHQLKITFGAYALQVLNGTNGSTKIQEAKSKIGSKVSLTKMTSARILQSLWVNITFNRIILLWWMPSMILWLDLAGKLQHITQMNILGMLDISMEKWTVKDTSMVRLSLYDFNRFHICLSILNL